MKHFLCGVFIGCGVIFMQRIVDAGPLASYPMNEANWTGPAPQVIDTSGNGHNGTAVGGATTTSDPAFGRVGSFDGSGQYVTLSGSYSMSAARSISAWVDPTSNMNLHGLPIVTGGTPNDGDFFGISGTGGEGSSLPEYELYIDHWSFPAYHSTSLVTPNTWSQVVMTYNGSGTVAFYIDGQPAGFASNSTSPYNLYSYNFSSYVIGGNTIGGSTTQGSFLGLMRDVEIYGYALSAGQVASLYQSESANPSPPAWTSTASGNWNVPGNWSTDAVPNGPAAAAALNGPTTVKITVTLNTPVTLGTLLLGNSGKGSTGYALTGAGSNTLTLDNSGNGATISVTGGVHVINAPVILADNLTVTTGGTAAWELSFKSAGSISDNGAGHSLTLSASNGILILSGSDSYTGGTFVGAGTLIATDSEALPDGSSLIVGNASLFGQVTAASTAVAVGSGLNEASPVPEPGTMALLAAVLGTVPFYRRVLRSPRMPRTATCA